MVNDHFSCRRIYTYILNTTGLFEVNGVFPKYFHLILQGLFVPFARIGSGDPVRVLRLLHNKYTGYN